MNSRSIAVSSAFLIMFGWNSVENFMSFYLSNFLTNSDISTIFISIYLPFALFSLIAVNVMQRPRHMVTIGSILYIPFMLTIALNPNKVLLTIFGILVGIGASLFFIGCSYYVLQSERKGRSAGIFTASISAGSGLAGISGGYFLLKHPFHDLFILGAVVLSTGSILSLLLKDVILNINIKTVELLRRKEIVKVGVLTFLGILFYGLSKSFVPIVTKEIGGNVFDVGIYAFTLVIFSLTVAMVGGELTDRIGRKFGFYVVMILSALCSFIVFFANNVFLIFIAGTIFSFVNVLTRTVSLATMGDLMDGLTAGALVMFFTSLSAVFSLALFGFTQNPRLPFLIVGVLSLLSLGLAKTLKVIKMSAHTVKNGIR
ncbi:hypothetical protein DRP04_10295 [Archaeoglobales archaeon]|nr:MAG: hypothetical protein DRP04_10295 [Archaeoglobales archaeon]